MHSIVSIFLLSPLFIFSQSTFEQAERLFQQEKYGQAKILFASYLHQNPTHSKTKEYLGDIAAYSKDWDMALVYYKELVEKSPGNANYNFKYGGSLGMKAKEGSKIRAITYVSDIKKYLSKATELDAGHIEARWAMVEMYMQLPGILGGSEETSLKYARQLLSISPVDGYLALGYIAEYSDRLKDAETYYKKAIETGGSPHTYEKLAELYETKANQPEKAMETREASIQKHKRNNLNYQIGKISAIYNVELQKGLFYLQTFLDNYSGKDMLPLEWGYYRMAQIYKHLGRKNEALSWIEKALALNGGFKEAMEEEKIIRNL